MPEERIGVGPVDGGTVRTIEARDAKGRRWRSGWPAFLAGGATVAISALAIAIAANGLVVRPAAPGASPTATPTAVSFGPSSPSASLATYTSPSPQPLSSEPPPQPSDSAWTPPALPTPPSVSGAPVTTRTISGSTKDGLVTYSLAVPSVSTPRSGAGAKIGSAVETIVKSHLTEFIATWDNAAGRDDLRALGRDTFWLHATYRVCAYLPASASGNPGFITFQLDYDYFGGWADAGPQWVDMVSFALDGTRVSITDQFADPTAALERLSNAAALNLPADMGPLDEKGYAPTAKNFSMWTPMPDGLLVRFPAMTITAAVFGSPTFIVPWSDLRGLIEPGSYLDWYLASRT